MVVSGASSIGANGPTPVIEPVALEDGFLSPPPEAQVRAYWWWLNGNVTAEAISRDLREMQAKGFGGALLCDAGGAEQRGNDQVPHGPDFFSAEWRELYRHTLREAASLGLEISLNIQSGWNLGGPMVTSDDAVKKLTWSEIEVTGPGAVTVALPAPPTNDGYYRDVLVLAWPIREAVAERRPLKHFGPKALIEKPTFTGFNAWFLANSAVDTGPLFAAEEPDVPGEEDAAAAAVTILSAQLAPDGTLSWLVPEGRWRVLRLGCTLGDLRMVSTHSEGWSGYALDPLDRGAFERYWDAVVEPLIDDAGDLAGTTLRYLHTDSWEVGAFNWTPTALEEFRRRRGYDPAPWLPVLAGRIIGSRTESNRFLHDYRRTLADLAADNHFRIFSERAARRGLGIHPESGGPHYTPIDAQQCLAINDVPMSEFWAESTTHRTTDDVRYFVKQPASAAHTAGHRYVAAEGFTTV
ncbi:MAG TPA: glycosyl hydrolase, partial [Candidatus Synoicihabitans sp.]|nr:glycosyl hydrolase [Candidatus Synoicihabitans sp.]